MTESDSAESFLVVQRLATCEDANPDIFLEEGGYHK